MRKDFVSEKFNLRENTGLIPEHEGVKGWTITEGQNEENEGMELRKTEMEKRKKHYYHHMGDSPKSVSFHITTLV